MDERAARMGLRWVGDDAAVIDINGDVTAAAEPALTSAYEDAAKRGARRLVLNFGGLEYMNSGGIGMLVTLLVHASRNRQKLAAFGLSRALPRDLRADPARRGHHHLRQRGVGGRRRRELRGPA